MPSLGSDIDMFLMIVVADALFTVFTIMTSCTKEEKTFTNICIIKKQMSALKNERGRYPVIKKSLP